MKKIIFLTTLCLCMVASLSAQTANDYFHSAANYYVNADKKNAQTAVQEGIRKYPDNSKLKTLAVKISELPDPENNQDQQNNQDKNQDQDKKDQQDQKNQDKQNQDKQDQKGQQPQQRQISPEDAQRILNALEQDEKDLQEKMQKKERAGSRPAIEKNW